MLLRQLVLAALSALLALPLTNAGCKKDEATSTTGAVATAASPAGAGVIAIEANEKGFTPGSVALKKGAPTTLVFRRTTDETCATKVVFPELNLTKDLPLNQPVSVEIPSGEARTLTFQCGMGMFKGKIVIS
jgi:plastocyanin domain-containing protein